MTFGSKSAQLVKDACHLKSSMRLLYIVEIICSLKYVYPYFKPMNINISQLIKYYIIGINYFYFGLLQQLNYRLRLLPY